MTSSSARLRGLCLCFLVLLGASAPGSPVEFNLPAQPADRALLNFSKQADVEVLFSSDELHGIQTAEVIGSLEPEAALERLLQGTGYVVRRRARGKFVVRAAARANGAVRGRLVTADGHPATGIRVSIPDTRQSSLTDRNGEYGFPAVPAGVYHLVITAEGIQPLRITDARVESNRLLVLDTQTVQPAQDPAALEPFVVRDRSGRSGPFDREDKLLPIRNAIGNSDLRRTEDDALPYTVYDRRELNRSGVVNLNEFLQRELIDVNPAARPPEQDGSADTFRMTSANLRLRGYTEQETVILINGRRMPEVVTANGGAPTLPDVNFVPLSLVQQVEVLPVSAAALYTGNAVGGVINIVLKPDVDAAASEVTATYTNALRGFDAPQSAVSVLHAQSLLRGALRIRFNLARTDTFPPTEAELGYHQRHLATPALGSAVYRATPNLRSSDGSALFGPGTSSYTSVSPGAAGDGGLAAFRGREGLRNLRFFDGPGGLAASFDSLDFPYGREQRRETYYGSVVYDVTPWLQVGADVTYSHIEANRGFEVVRGDLTLSGTSALNPFGKDVEISLNETAPALGETYSAARLDFVAAVMGAMIKLPGEWRLSSDFQYATNVTRYRGLAGVDSGRWQSLVDRGLYNPLRDTQRFAPPASFYDQVLVYRGRRGQFQTLGNYDTLDAAARVTNETLPLPTGNGALNFGADYRRNHLDSSRDEARYSDGTLFEEPTYWNGRTLQRYSVFGELQAPLLKEHWRPAWLKDLSTDLAVRYIASNSGRESNVAPTYGLKFELTNGLAFRGSLTTSNRLPTPYMSHKVETGSGGPDGGVTLTPITDHVRNEQYSVRSVEDINPNVRPESAVTQTAGLLFLRSGKGRKFRLALDFVDTRKTNELAILDEQKVVDLEPLLPERVIRETSNGESIGRISRVITGLTNLARRHSQNWTLSGSYSWQPSFGGVIETYGRALYFQRYEIQGLPTSPVVDELRHPDGNSPDILRFRSNAGVSWSNHDFGFGAEGHYFHSRQLQETYWTLQGGRDLGSYWDADAYVQVDLRKWLPWSANSCDLRVQLRVNNLLENSHPRYAVDAATGVQPYGDWRGRTYSLSLTASF